jgi:nucleotide-binding universal stress UspA family protein
MDRRTTAGKDAAMASRILVPLDGSLLSERALPVAVKLARGSGGTLYLVRIHVPPTRPPVSLEGVPVVDRDEDSRCWEAERAYLTRIRKGLGPGSELATRIAVLNGPVEEVLATYAVLHRIELIVMATHGRHGLARAWMGSVSDALLRTSRMPVLLVRASDEAAAEGPAEERPRILITLDGSAIAEKVVEPAVDLGRSLQATYTLLRVVNHGLMGDLPTVFAPRIGRAIAAQHEAEAAAYLTQIARSIQDRGLDVKTRVVASEHVAAAILAEAEREGCGLVAMATHGRSGLSRMVMGSVAGEVLPRAKVPVLLYRPRMERRRLGAQPATIPGLRLDAGAPF